MSNTHSYPIRRPARVFAAAFAVCAGVLGFAAPPQAAPLQIGQPAPDFTAQDSKGNGLNLSQYRGKTVVLEWSNADCPFTHKHYASGNMQSIQALAQKNGVIWLTVISSAFGKQGYVNGPAADALTQSRSASPDRRHSGSVGDPRPIVWRQDNAPHVRHRQEWRTAIHGRH